MEEKKEIEPWERDWIVYELEEAGLIKADEETIGEFNRIRGLLSHRAEVEMPEASLLLGNLFVHGLSFSKFPVIATRKGDQYQGHEYPLIYMKDTEIKYHSETFRDMVLAHETAHQWFRRDFEHQLTGMLNGNDTGKNPRLAAVDEAFAYWFTDVVYGMITLSREQAESYEEFSTNPEMMIDYYVLFHQLTASYDAQHVLDNFRAIVGDATGRNSKIVGIEDLLEGDRLNYYEPFESDSLVAPTLTEVRVYGYETESPKGLRERKRGDFG